MKDPQAPVRNEVLGGDGDLRKIARRVDAKKNNLVPCAKVRRGIVCKHGCDASQKLLVVLADECDARVRSYPELVVERSV